MILHAWHPSECEGRTRKRYIYRDVESFHVDEFGWRQYTIPIDGKLRKCAFSPSDKYKLFDDDGRLIKSGGSHSR